MSRHPTPRGGRVPRADSPDVWLYWTREYPIVTTQPNGRIWINQYGISHSKTWNYPFFFPLKLLKHIFTKQVLSREIEDLEELDEAKKDLLVEQILGSNGTDSETYIQVFATLKIINCLRSLPAFISAGASDQKLPLSSDPSGQTRLLFYRKSKEPLPAYILTEDKRFSFLEYQYWMVVPFFDNQRQPYDLSWTIVSPYYEVPHDTETSEESYRIFGVGRSVSRILIHPLCHAFHTAFDALQGPGKDMFFALKRSRKRKPDSFRKQVEMLQRFDSTKHPRIVKILATFTRCEENFLVFPWATHNLNMYWRTASDTGNVELVRWICCQAWLLVEDISRIHDVPEDPEIPEHKRLYGRHGDLKPANILWYRSQEGFGKLLIADMGLSKTSRFESKFYYIGEDEEFDNPCFIPRYRPPEVDYSNDLMGRTFDIWALGCIFLEMLSWLHGGPTRLQDMEIDLLNSSSQDDRHAHRSTAYYEWVYVRDVGFHIVRLKEIVTKWIQTLRGECSQFAYDFLNIIEDQMLVIDHHERVSARDLVKKMEDLHRKCKESEYCVKKKEHEPRDAPKPKLQRKEAVRGLKIQGLYLPSL